MDIVSFRSLAAAPTPCCFLHTTETLKHENMNKGEAKNTKKNKNIIALTSSSTSLFPSKSALFATKAITKFGLPVNEKNDQLT